MGQIINVEDVRVGDRFKVGSTPYEITKVDREISFKEVSEENPDFEGSVHNNYTNVASFVNNFNRDKTNWVYLSDKASYPIF